MLTKIRGNRSRSGVFSKLVAQKLSRALRWSMLAGVALSISGCEDPKIYGSVGMSTGYGGYYGGYNGWGSPRMHTSISIGGRIR